MPPCYPLPPPSSDFAFQGCASALAQCHSDLFQCPEPRAALPCGVNTALCSCSHSAPCSAQAVLLLAAAALRWVLLCHLTSSQLCAGRSAEHRAPTRSRGSACSVQSAAASLALQCPIPACCTATAHHVPLCAYRGTAAPLPASSFIFGSRVVRSDLSSTVFKNSNSKQLFKALTGYKSVLKAYF